MADITVTVANATTQENRGAAWALAKINAQRTEQNLSTFATLQDYLEYEIGVERLASWIQGEAAENEQTQSIKERWQAATDAERAAALAALPTLP